MKAAVAADFTLGWDTPVVPPRCVVDVAKSFFDATLCRMELPETRGGVEVGWRWRRLPLIVRGGGLRLRPLEPLPVGRSVARAPPPVIPSVLVGRVGEPAGMGDCRRAESDSSATSSSSGRPDAERSGANDTPPTEGPPADAREEGVDIAIRGSAGPRVVAEQTKPRPSQKKGRERGAIGRGRIGCMAGKPNGSGGQ